MALESRCVGPVAIRVTLSSTGAVVGGERRPPHRPRYDRATRDRAAGRTAENQAVIWEAYEELVAFAAEHLAVVTSTEFVKLAEETRSRERNGVRQSSDQKVGLSDCPSTNDLGERIPE